MTFLFFFSNIEHKCFITRALRSAGRGRLSRNTSVVGGLWIFFFFSSFLSLYRFPWLILLIWGPADPLLVVWRGFLPHGSLQTDQLSKTTVHFIKTLICVCPPYRLPTQTTRSGQGHHGVSAFLMSLSVRSSHAPSFLSCGVVRELAEDGVCGGISMTPLLSCVLSPHRSPADPPAKALPSFLILQITAATSAACKQTPSWSRSLELTMCGHPLSCLRLISLAH